MKILIVGMGVVGKTTARGFSKFGHSVLCRDLDGDRPASDICFICTPEGEVTKAIKGIETGCLTIRSTTVPGTITSLGEHVCHNPCFGREKTAYEDFMHPPMIVIGECCEYHGDILAGLYSGFDAPIFRVDVTTSEMIKLTMNSYLATQISFWNEISMVCDKLGISSNRVSEVCKSDPRVSKYGTLWSGHSFDGKCLPKDLRNMVELFRTNRIDAELLRAVETVNRNLENELCASARV